MSGQWQSHNIESSRCTNMPPSTPQAAVTADNNNNGNWHRARSNKTDRTTKRSYHGINVVLISAALVLLLHVSPIDRATGGVIPTRWRAEAFDPHSSVLTPFRGSATIPPSLFRPKTATILPPNRISHHRLYATDKQQQNGNKPKPSWSKAAMVTTTETDAADASPKVRTESRIGVRRRVKSVLRKARRRTGIRNGSDAEDEDNGRGRRSSIPSVVADAAAIGGLGTGDFDFIETEPNGGGISDPDTTNGADANGAMAPLTKNKKAPASTYSKPPLPLPDPDESLVLSTPTSTSATATTTPLPPPSSPEMDVFRSDVSAAFSLPPPPLPFTLPTLTPAQKSLLTSGERVQFQSEMGREGSGFVVFDVRAPAAVVWECLLDFGSYTETIPTVQRVSMADAGMEYGVSGTSRASFTLSKKFRLQVSVVHKYKVHPQGDHLIFELDESSKNFVLNKAKGVWYTESEADGLEPGLTRVWLLAELKVSRILPRMIVDYAAKKAMPRATTWIKPHVETAASLWLRPDKEQENEQ